MRTGSSHDPAHNPRFPTSLEPFSLPQAIAHPIFSFPRAILARCLALYRDIYSSQASSNLS